MKTEGFASTNEETKRKNGTLKKNSTLLKTDRQNDVYHFKFYNEYYHSLFWMLSSVPKNMVRLNWSVQFSPTIDSLISTIKSCTLAFVFSYKQNTNVSVIWSNMHSACFPKHTKMHWFFYLKSI